MGMPPRYKLETLHEAKSELGFLSHMCSIDGHVFASGGTYRRPTLLYAPDGRHFQVLRPPHTLGLRGTLVISLDQIYVVGEHGMLALTKDLGKHWEIIPTGLSSCLYRIVKIGNLLLLCGDGGLHGSDDGGLSWMHLQRTDGRLLGLSAYGNRLYGVGEDAQLLIYEDRRCTLLPVPAWDTLTHIVRTPGDHLLISGDDGQLFRSQDEGQTWTQVGPKLKCAFEDITVFNEHIFVCGQGGHLLHSNDDGQTWNALKTNTRVTLWSLLAAPDGVYIGAEDGQIMRLSLEGQVAPPSPKSPKSAFSKPLGKEPKER